MFFKQLISSLLFFLAVLVVVAAAARPSSPTKFQYLNVKATKLDFNDGQILHTLNFSDAHRQVSGHKSHNDTFKLNLLHRDKLSHVHGHRRGFNDRMKRDAIRVATLVRRLSHSAAAVEDSRFKVANFATDVISGEENYYLLLLF